MYICIFTYIHTYIYLHKYIYIYLCVYIYVYIHIYVHMYIYRRRHSLICRRLWQRLGVEYIHTHIYVYTHIYVHMYIYRRRHSLICRRLWQRQQVRLGVENIFGRICTSAADSFYVSIWFYIGQQQALCIYIYRFTIMYRYMYIHTCMV